MRNEYCEYLCELFEPFAPVVARPMFGGQGLFVEKLMVGLVVDNALYLKVDDVNRKEFTDLDLEAFSYRKANKQVQMNFYEAPETIYEEPEQAGLWFNSAYGAAVRAKKNP